jgi:hypothetical protein
VSSLQTFVEAISHALFCGGAFDVVEIFLQRPASGINNIRPPIAPAKDFVSIFG